MANTLSYKKIFLFWVPLAITWLMMSVEGPYLSAIIARMGEPKYNLAAYGISFSFALIIEAPVIMLMSAATALVNNSDSYKKLKNFTYTLNAVITLFMLVILIPKVFDFIAVDLIELPAEVVGITYWALAALLPWPAAIGYRRFYQGILIRNNRTRFVTAGTFIRLVTMSITALVLYFKFAFPGAVVASLALSMGVSAEALASKLMSLTIVKKIKTIKAIEGKEELTYKGIIEFYYPLALTSMLSLGVYPIVTFMLGQSRMAIESLAVLPVVNALVFIFRSIGLSYHEVFIALLGEKGEGYKPLRNFGLIVGSGSVLILMMITVTPLSKIWFHYISGLSIELTQLSVLPAIIASILPGLTFLISVQRAIQVYARNTSPLTFATIIEVVGIIIVLFVGIKVFDLVGVLAAAIAYVSGRMLANIYLIKANKEAIKKFE
ncbi:hypothetical protein MNBD_IGNAVI01-3198 [hydrothermal vent metagenome]|uniref:Polysaccharide biosynthesis protein C-terminal domain-containing protein n=1 Tax=hydrothermal vent metagenome TaxID=652676 RepID=A0A3B1C257_9ZZZZ